MNSFDITTIGHFSIDHIKLPNRKGTKSSLGGPPTYVSLTAKKLGANVSVISKVGADFPNRFQRFLRLKGVDLHGLKKDRNASTTSFLLDYGSNRERELFLLNRAPPMEAVDIPDIIDSRVIHVAPIVNEIPPETLQKIKASKSIISLDPQGFVREFDVNGKMRLGLLEDPEVLNEVDILKASYDEAIAITRQKTLADMAVSLRKKGVKIIIITKGAEDASLYAKGKMFSVPSTKPKAVVDTTGAGDAFIGAFLSTFVCGEEPLWCACMGSAAASFVVEKYGSSGFGSLRQVRARATEVYDKALAIP